MNERIWELAEQAGIKIIPMVVDGVDYEYEDVDMDGSEDLEKFADLIIKECLGIAQDRAAFDWAPPNDVNHIISEIKEHFGV